MALRRLLPVFFRIELVEISRVVRRMEISIRLGPYFFGREPYCLAHEKPRLSTDNGVGGKMEKPRKGNFYIAIAPIMGQNGKHGGATIDLSLLIRILKKSISQSLRFVIIVLHSRGVQ